MGHNLYASSFRVVKNRFFHGCPIKTGHTGLTKSEGKELPKTMLNGSQIFVHYSIGWCSYVHRAINLIITLMATSTASDIAMCPNAEAEYSVPMMRSYSQILLSWVVSFLLSHIRTFSRVSWAGAQLINFCVHLDV